MTFGVRGLVALSVLAGTLAIPGGSPAYASTRCDPLVQNSRANALREKTSSGRLLAEYLVRVSWCTAPNKNVQVRVYSPRRTRAVRVTASGVLAGWSFERVLSEDRSYYTYNQVPYGGYYVKTRVKFVRCVVKILQVVCTDRPGWLDTYAHYDGTATVRHGWG